MSIQTQYKSYTAMYIFQYLLSPLDKLGALIFKTRLSMFTAVNNKRQAPVRCAWLLGDTIKVRKGHLSSVTLASTLVNANIRGDDLMVLINFVEFEGILTLTIDGKVHDPDTYFELIQLVVDMLERKKVFDTSEALIASINSLNEVMSSNDDVPIYKLFWSRRI